MHGCFKINYILKMFTIGKTYQSTLKGNMFDGQSTTTGYELGLPCSKGSSELSECEQFISLLKLSSRLMIQKPPGHRPS